MKSFGGNSGYIGYSESVRSSQAKTEGRFPKTEFKKVYGISEKKFQELLACDVIYQSEWHHTSKYGKRTKFYDIADPVLFYAKAGRMEEAFAIYKESRDYSAPIFKNENKQRYVTIAIIDKTDPVASELISAGVRFKRTKRGNYSFSICKDEKHLFKNAIVRSVFRR